MVLQLSYPHGQNTQDTCNSETHLQNINNLQQSLMDAWKIIDFVYDHYQVAIWDLTIVAIITITIIILLPYMFQYYYVCCILKLPNCGWWAVAEESSWCCTLAGCCCRDEGCCVTA